MNRVAVVGTFDSKGEENQYLIGELHRLGLETLTVDIGMRGEALFAPDYDARAVAYAGGGSLDRIRGGMPHSQGLGVMSRGAAAIISECNARGEIGGIIAMGGGQGTYMICEILRALPLSLPKLLLSTVVELAGAESLFAGTGDTLLMNSVVDIAGLNFALCAVIRRAAAAMYGMVTTAAPAAARQPERKRIGISMWGVTTLCVDGIRKRLERAGYEVLVFHANGIGGDNLEKYAANGLLCGIMDVTLSEIMNPLAGAAYPVIADRITRGIALPIPRVVVPGGIDMLQMADAGQVPERFASRKRYYHNQDLLFVRSNPEECVRFADDLLGRLSGHGGPVSLLLPGRGVSAADVDGGPLRDERADRALFRRLKERAGDDIRVAEYDAHINDPEFSEAAAREMLRLLEHTDAARKQSG